MTEEELEILQNKKSFILYYEQAEIFLGLSKEEAGELIQAIFAYVTGQDYDLKEKTTKMLFVAIKAVIERNKTAYIESVKRSRNNGKNGGRPKGTNKKPSGLSNNLDDNKKPSGLSNNLVGFNKPDSVSVSVSESDSEIKNNNIFYLEEKEEKQKNLSNSFNPDLMFNKNIEKVFDLYKELCPNLIPIKFEKRDKDRRQQIKDLLELCENDFEYIKELFVKANEQIIFYDEKISFKSLIKNHEAIYQGKGNKINTQQEDTRTTKEIEVNYAYRPKYT